MTQPPPGIPIDDMDRLYSDYKLIPGAQTKMGLTPARVLVAAGLATIVREVSAHKVFVQITPTGILYGINKEAVVPTPRAATKRRRQRTNMKTEKLLAGVEWRSRFPGATVAFGGEGWSLLTDPAHPTVMIIDNGSMLDFMDEDEKATDPVVTILTFSTEAERNEAMRRRRPARA